MPLSTTRSPRVDFLRGLSILAVLLLHFSLSYDLSDSPLSRVVPKSWIEAIAFNGNYGVTVFFVISGFLITSNNLRRYGHLGAVNLRDFYVRRFARIIPPLLLALAVIVPLGLCHVPSFVNSVDGRELPSSFFWIVTLSVLTFWHNVLMQSAGWFNYCLNIYWSLSVEEVFYLTFPIACVLLKRRWFVIALCAAFIVAGPLYRNAHREDELFFECGYLACFDAVAFGCVTALLYRRIQTGLTIGRGVRTLAGGALAAAYLFGIEGHEALGFSLVALCAATLLSNAFENSPAGSNGLPARTIRWFGRHSYELYLFHIVVLAAIRNIVPKGTMTSGSLLPWFLGFIASSAIVAAVVARCYSEPLNARLRTYWSGGRLSAAAS